MCSIISWNFLSLSLTSFLCYSMSIKMSVIGTVGLLPVSPSDSSPSEVGSCVSAFRFRVYLDIACPLCVSLSSIDGAARFPHPLCGPVFSLQLLLPDKFSSLFCNTKKVASSPYAGLSLKTAATKVGPHYSIYLTK